MALNEKEMVLTVLKSKIHRIEVTEANLHYEGSIFIDEEILQKAHILAYEKVEIYNVNNGQRFSTYAVPVETKGTVCVNGAASRLVHKGDLLIVCTYAQLPYESAKTHRPVVVLF